MDQWMTLSGAHEIVDTGEAVPAHVTVDAQRPLVRDVLPAVVEASPTAIAVFRRDRHPTVGGHVPRSGLGLYVERALVEANGGRLWLRSRRGGGTEAGFALPAYVDAARSRGPLTCRCKARSGDRRGAGIPTALRLQS